jgi:hypothetical protein
MPLPMLPQREVVRQRQAKVSPQDEGGRREMILPSEKEKKITTDIAVAKGKKVGKRGKKGKKTKKKAKC